VIFRQYYLGCLSQASYLIGDESTGRAVVVDPQRDVSGYLADARQEHLTIERIIETHFHADFVSGHLELADQTGAPICYGEAADPEFAIEHLRDGERISLGAVEIEVRATPGHTPESISLVVYEHAGDSVPYAVLSGDTLFIGDVGRPDLLSSEGAAPEMLARQLYQSLHEKLLTLPDATRLYPAHGAGSACGKHLSTETTSTIGEQRRRNYALRAANEDEFVALVTRDQPAQPPYFSFSARRNRQQHSLLGEHRAPEPLSLERALALQAGGGVLLDTRSPADFATGHLRGSLNVGLEGRFAEYAGDVITPDQPIVLLGDTSTELEGKVRLARIGFDNIAGYLDQPMRVLLEHPELAQVGSRLTALDLAHRIEEVPDLVIVDVRNPGELERGVIPGSRHIPLATLAARLDALDPSRPTVVHCAGGYRSSIGASLLRANGFSDVSDLVGGYEAWAGMEPNRSQG
jgi:hydroxyacylglutathione hydrolase